MGADNTSVTNQTGGVDFGQGNEIEIKGDVVGGNIYYGYTAEEVERLIAEIRREDQPKRYDGRKPYLGLAAFQEDNADFFFGREKTVGELVERVSRSRFVCIAGPSGSGKSSLAQAGLIYALRRGLTGGSDKWLYAALSPQNSPIEQLALAMARLARTPEAARYIRENGLKDANALHDQVESLLSHHRPQRAVIYVDQFEEIFTQTKSEEEQRAFIDLLTTAVERDGGRTTAIISLRSDFVSQCASYPRLRALLSREFQLVGAMEPQELARAITQPALEVGVKIDPDLVSRVIADMRGEPGALPLMQFALKDLFDSRSCRKGDAVELALAEYLERGGIQKALERHADNVLVELDAERQEIAREVFTQLIGIGPGVAATRRAASFTDLTHLADDQGKVYSVIASMADARLLTTAGSHSPEAGGGGRPDDGRTVTIAHEKLIEAWPWLRKIVEEKSEIIALQSSLNDNAAEWESSRRDESYLYSGARLETMREQAAAKKLKLSRLASDFIAAGIERQKREEQRWKDLYESLRSRELAAVSQSQLDADPEVSLLIAVEASRSAHTFESEDALRQALQRSRLRGMRRYGKFDFGPTSASFSPDGQRIVIGFGGGRIEVWDRLLQHLTLTIKGHERGVYEAVFSPRGDQILSAGSDGTARIWSSVAGEELMVLRSGENSVTGAKFSSDGKMIVTGHMDGVVKIWDSETGEPLVQLIGHDKKINSVQFSPGDRFVITASNDRTARLWDSTSGEEVTLWPHKNDVLSADISTKLNYLVVTADWDGLIKEWRTDWGDRVLADLGRRQSTVRCVRFSPTDSATILICEHHVAFVLNTILHKDMFSLRGHTSHIIKASFSPDGQFIVTAGDDHSVRLWDASPNREGMALPWGDLITFSPTEKNRVAVAGSASRAGKSEAGPSKAGGDDAGSPGSSAAVSRIARVLDLATGQEFPLLGEHSTEITSIRFAGDGRRIVTSGFDEAARVWDVATGEVIQTVRSEFGLGNFLCASLSPDGKKLVTAHIKGSVIVWDVESGEALANLHDHSADVMSVDFSPSSNQIVSAGYYGAVFVQDVEKKTPAMSLEGHNDVVTCARFSSDGKQVVTASRDHTARLWDAETGQELQVFVGHQTEVTSASFSPDNRRIVTACYDQTARIWDIKSGRVLSILRHDNRVNNAEFSLDGKWVATGSSGGFRLFYVEIEDLLELAKSRVTRDLTAEERRTYLGE